MNKFTTPIRVEYPPHNKQIFEEWFAENYEGCNTDRELLPILPTAYHVNHNYGNDESARRFLQDYCDNLDQSKKYFIICQYDDGTLIDWKGKDVLEFNMSKKVGVEIPLLCQPHPYKFDTGKKYIASFVGSRTHPVRDELEKFKYNENWYISYEPHSIEEYCKIIHESVFTLCPRGYGLNSFRISESLQFGSIPVYISDDFIIPFSCSFMPQSFPGWWLLISSGIINKLPSELSKVSEKNIFDLVQHGEKAYEKYYTYEGAMKQIIKCLESEPKN